MEISKAELNNLKLSKALKDLTKRIERINTLILNTMSRPKRAGKKIPSYIKTNKAFINKKHGVKKK